MDQISFEFCCQGNQTHHSSESVQKLHLYPSQQQVLFHQRDTLSTPDVSRKKVLGSRFSVTSVVASGSIR